MRSLYDMTMPDKLYDERTTAGDKFDFYFGLSFDPSCTFAYQKNKQVERVKVRVHVDTLISNVIWGVMSIYNLFLLKKNKTNVKIWIQKMLY